jgi:hypothetical protein
MRLFLANQLKPELFQNVLCRFRVLDLERWRMESVNRKFLRHFGFVLQIDILE